MIRILFFIPTLTGGGAEKVLCNLVNNMDQSQFDITVQTIDECSAEMYLKDGIHYKAINRCKTGVGKKIFFLLFRLCAELKLAYRFWVKDHYDIEVAYLETIATKVIGQSCNKKAAKIAWVHCDLSLKDDMKGKANKIEKIYSVFDKIVCVSHDAQFGFHKLLGQDFNTIVLPNVIDDTEILEKSKKIIQYHGNPSAIQMIAVGRLTRQKNFSYLLDSCSKLRDDGCHFFLNILGEGPERENLEQKIIDLELENFVTLRGFISNPYPWIKQADIVVCSSKYEGISTVIQEALIMNKPIVTTPCTGMTELLGNSEYGMIVTPSIDGLYKGLYQMISSKDLRYYYSERAKERSHLLSKSLAIRLTQDFFLNVLH